MLIGILSDTHGRADATRSAIQLLQSLGTEYFIHCGDVGSREVLDHLAGLRSLFVFGNTDYDRADLARYAEIVGVTCYQNLAEMELDGKQIAVIHGDNPHLKNRILAQQAHDYLFQGHTHIAGDERVGRIRVINPGALHRAARKTVATLDTRTDDLNFHLVGP